MSITNNVGCPIANCTVDLGPICTYAATVASPMLMTAAGPQPIQGPFDSTGFPVGCKSACFANLDGNPSACRFHSDRLGSIKTPCFAIANSPNCCSGSFDTAATCPSSGVEFYSFFSSHLSSHTHGSFLTCMNRGKLPERLRLRLRRVFGHGALDVRFGSERRLHSNILPVSTSSPESHRQS